MQEQEKPQKAGRPAWRRSDRFVAAVGGVVIVLAAIGLISLVNWGLRATMALLDNTKEVERLERFLYPAVMFDPIPFNSLSEADPVFLLEASMWGALLGENRENYAYDDVGMLVVPATDLDVAATRLFGSQVVLNHRTFSDYEISYAYDEGTMTYHVPLTAKITYSPQVESITKNGDLITVRVGYVPPGNVWEMDLESNRYEPTPDKYMLYDLQKEKNEYHIVAVRDVEELAITGPRS